MTPSQPDDPSDKTGIYVKVEGEDDEKEDAAARSWKNTPTLQNELGAVSILLGYTFIKWTYVLIDYVRHGVQAEANIFLMFLVIPFGVIIWLAGLVQLISKIIKVFRKRVELVRTDSKIVLAVDCALAVCTTVELAWLWSMTSGR